MLRRDYLSRLSRAARWRLGAKEAEEVIADYREIVGNPPRPEGELYRELGKPRLAVKRLVEPKRYGLWLALFAFMSGCILVLGISAAGTNDALWMRGPTGFPSGPFENWFYDVRHFLWRWLFEERPFHLRLGPVTAAVGAVTVLVWSRRRGEKRGRLSKAVPVLLAACLVLLGCVMLFCWAFYRDKEGFTAMWGFFGSEYRGSRSVRLSGCVMSYSVPILAVLGVFALVKTRTEDRRWAAVYVLAMTIMLVCLEILALPDRVTASEPTWESYFSPYFYSYIVLTVTGLMGTGVALC